MTGLDTNVLLRWLVDDDLWPDDAPDQTKATAALLGRRDAQFFVNVVVIAETVWVLAKPLGQPKAVIADVIARLLQASNIVIDRRDAVEAALGRWVTGKAGFTDHLIGKINRGAGCDTTFTFDRAASRAGDFTRLRQGS